MIPLVTRDLRAAVRVTGGAVRDSAAGIEFYRLDRPYSGTETVSVLVGVWDGGQWLPLGGPAVVCPDAAAAIDLFRAASLARGGPPKPLTACKLKDRTRQSAVTTGRGVPRNRGTKPLLGAD